MNLEKKLSNIKQFYKEKNKYIMFYLYRWNIKDYISKDHI